MRTDYEKAIRTIRSLDYKFGDIVTVVNRKYPHGRKGIIIGIMPRFDRAEFCYCVQFSDCESIRVNESAINRWK